MVSEIRYVRANRVELGYQVHSEESGKPPLIFGHGYSGRSTNIAAYNSLLTMLAKEFTIHALDLRGHGASAAVVEGFTLSAMADDVAAATRQLGLRGALYVGHSLGGLMGLYCEVRHPATFSAMCLLATGAARCGTFSDLFVQHGHDKAFLLNALSPGYQDSASADSHVEAAILIDRRVHEAF